MKWTIPMVVSVTLVFLVPKTILALQIAFIFVTYNLFNTILYTYVCMAFGSLPSYATDDSVDRSQTLVYSMLVAAAMQTILASTIMPMVNFFGGQNVQSAWVKSILVFGALGIVFLYLNVFFVKERVENSAPPENIVAGIKAAVKNKYWVYTLFANICNNIMLVFNLSVYYLNTVVGNLGLKGAYIAVSNIPGVILMIFLPSILAKVSKQKLAVFGSILMPAAQIAFILGPSDNVTWLLGTGLLRGFGMGFPMGLNGAMIGDCIDYGEWTSLLGFFLTAVGYDSLKEVQSAATIAGIDNFFKFVPVIVCIILIIFSYLFDLEKKLPGIQKDLQERRGAAETR